MQCQKKRKHLFDEQTFQPLWSDKGLHTTKPANAPHCIILHIVLHKQHKYEIPKTTLHPENTSHPS